MKRTLLILIWVFSASLGASAQTTFYFPQIADGTFTGGFWKTTIFITNPAATGASLASGSITFTKSDGTVFNVAFVDSNGAAAGSGNVIPFQLAGGQTRKYVSTASTGLNVGFATVSSSAVVTGTAVFSQFGSAGNLISEAGVPSAGAVTRQAIFVDTLGGFRTGVAYANPNAAGANISLQLLSTEGVAVVPSTTRTLLGNQHTAAFVHELFPSAPAFTGTMQITSNAPLTAVALRFDPSFTLFTTLPPITIASLVLPAMQWFEHRPWLTPFTTLARLMGSLQFTL